jgi:hypothetical protein
MVLAGCVAAVLFKKTRGRATLPKWIYYDTPRDFISIPGREAK